jgi:uncharacterized protein (TIGR00375 family)
MQIRSDMRTVVDLHAHSHYSRATSKHLTVEGLARAAAEKGVDVMATGDITHPKWLNELEEKLVDDGSGFFRLRDGSSPTRFVLSGEVANMYKKNGKGRRVHMLFVVSSFAAARAVNTLLTDRGFNLKYDGRPIVGMDAAELSKIYLDADPRALVIPAHIWTPWFSVFGSKSGFNSLEECFGDVTPFVYAIETGLSSDPDMNWRMSNLNTKMILSNSDAHSAEKVGREANVFDLPEQTFAALHASIRENKNLTETIEFFPEEGKYHLDGHRSCGVRLEPAQTKKLHGLCPKCGLPLVIGVLNRVEELADQPVKSRPVRVPFRRIVPLPEIIAEAYAVGVSSKKVKAMHAQLLAACGNEFRVLLEVAPEEIAAASTPLIGEAVRRVRAGQFHIEPGYDGVFGVVRIFSAEDRDREVPAQRSLF